MLALMHIPIHKDLYFVVSLNFERECNIHHVQQTLHTQQ
jgi:hypothetical protein